MFQKAITQSSGQASNIGSTLVGNGIVHHSDVIGALPAGAAPITSSFPNYNMTVWIWAGNYISFTIAAGLIRLHMPGVKKSRV